MSTKSVTRRSVVSAAAMGSVAAGLAGFAGNAVAAPADFTFAETVAWDAEYDVIVMGMGFAGLVSAEAAADEGVTVLLIDKCDKVQAGGNSRVCGQQIAYGYGDVEGTYTYLKALSCGRDISEEMLRTFAEGMANSADLIAERYDLDRDKFVDMKVNATVPTMKMFAPEYPEYPCSDTITVMATSETTSGGLYKMLRQHLQDKYHGQVDVWFESPGVGLIQDPVSKAVVGMRIERGGETRNVRARNGVVMACGGFENNRSMAANYLNLLNYVPQGTLYNTGDGHRMCMEIGARMWHMDVWEGSAAALGTSLYVPEGNVAINLVGIGLNGLNTGAIMYVGDLADRFGDESYGCRHGHIPAGNNVWAMPNYPQNIYAVWDEQQNQIIEEGGLVNDAYLDTIVACASYDEAAAAIGCDVEQLRATIDRFNFFVSEGVDYQFDRPIDTMRAFEGEALYVMPLKPILLNTQGGPERNPDAQIIDLAGEPIPHLYSAGEFGGFTSCLYQGSTNVCECFIFGYIAGKNAAAPKDELPVFEIAEAVASDPVQAGDETDIAPEEEYEVNVGSGKHTGAAEGMGGKVVVSLDLDEDGVITSVVVMEENETEGIGSNAIKQMPERFKGLSTAEEIDAVDGVSGASITSQALRDAVKQAAGLV